jgi:hypothetical protein
MTRALNRILVVGLAITEQVICEVISRVGTVKVEPTLRVLEPILHLLVESPTAAHLRLVTALGPGNVIANLIAVRNVVPWRPVRCVLRTGATVQVDGRNRLSTFGPVKRFLLFDHP